MTDEPPAAPTSARVLGLGVMGRGIARLLAGAGVEVTVADADAQRTADGLAALEREAAADDAPVEVRAVAIDAPADVDLVIEATSEDPAIKAQVVATMAAIAGPDTMLATNTSSLSVDELGRASGVPERFVGLHFFNPPTRLPLVEVVAGTWCEPAVVDRAVGWVEALGQQAVRCVDAPGFIVNRVCRPLYGEAQRLVELGERPAVIDLLARRVLGHRMGPVETLDLVGLHVHVSSCDTARREFGDPRYGPAQLTRRLVRAGATGRGAGRGFYDHSSERPSVQQAATLRPAVGRVVDLRTDATTVATRDDIVRWRPDGPATDADVAAVHALSAAGHRVVVDSSDGRWAADLPAGADWVHVHETADGPVVEVVADDVADIAPSPAVDDLVATLGGIAVDVLALPGLVVDRLWTGLVNEASRVVESGIAIPDDVDRALRLGMRHPQGPFEVLDARGPERAVAVLDMLDRHTRDGRFAASPRLRRQAAAVLRTRRG